jgi:hypothetical protein
MRVYRTYSVTLQRKACGYDTPGHSTVQLYAEVLAQFCLYIGKNPDQLVTLPSRRSSSSSILFGAGLAKGLSKKTMRIGAAVS